MGSLFDLRGRRIGLALSGGSVRGIAHIGVIKALQEAGIVPDIIVGTSAGSIVGAGLAAGMTWQELARMARSVFWPGLLLGRNLERFCRRYLPADFASLNIRFAAIATDIHSRAPVILDSGDLASAISASCAMQFVRPPVRRSGLRLKDGGMTCVLPSQICLDRGADFVVASDVWAWSAFLRTCRVSTLHPGTARLYSRHYLRALDATDILVTTPIPLAGYVPGSVSIERLIQAGETAGRIALISPQTAD